MQFFSKAAICGVAVRCEADAVDAMGIPRTWKTTVFLSLMPKAGEADLIVTAEKERAP
jgi:hypothetical protein